MARLIALLIAITTGGTGFLPSVESYRCVAMNRAMEQARPCCPKCDPPPGSIGKPCCERVISAGADARSAPSFERTAGAPPMVGVLSQSGAGSVESQPRARALPALSRGRPPGLRLQLFSTVLRV